MHIGNAIMNTDRSDNVYIQGSFSIGTVVKPYSKASDCDYDVDLVACDDGTLKSQTDPRTVKKTLGDTIRKSYSGYPCKEKRRCWTLEPKDADIPYHVDILACVPENANPDSTAIAITDTDESHTEYRWKSSNPRSFCKWFEGVDEEHSSKKYEQLISDMKKDPELKSDVDEINANVIGTPMRSVIKILKRHRDVFFSDREDSDYAPVSILISTAVANIVSKSDQEYNDVWTLLSGVIPRMGTAISKVNGKYSLKNPVDSKEDFADRWNDDARYVSAYGAWVNALKSWKNAISASTEKECRRSIESGLGLRNGSVNVPIPIPKSMDPKTAPMCYRP